MGKGIGKMDLVKSGKTAMVNKTIIDNFYNPQKEDRILVAGAGNGQEGVNISKLFPQKIFAVDINIDHNKFPDEENIIFETQDITKLKYEDDYFALGYSYHVLEHVPEPEKAVEELYRVLKPGGVLFIGFPNRSRIIGYLGSHNTTSIKGKLKLNYRDYKYRLKGKFHNKYGAHAGFSESEFYHMSRNLFADVIPVRNDYMRLKYKKRISTIEWLIKLNVQNVAFPSNYFICLK